MSRIVIDFSWQPHSGEFFFTLGGTSFPYQTQADKVQRTTDSRYTVFTTPINIQVQFQANVVLPEGVQPIEYKWNFGDGHLGYGAIVTHEYKVSIPEAQVKLTLLDDTGRRTSGSQIINLAGGSGVVVMAPSLRLG